MRAHNTFVSNVSHPLKAALCLLASATVLLAGCGIATSGSAPAAAATPMSGRVHGGQQAVSGAILSLYAAGTSGVGTGASSRLLVPVMTDQFGNFSITKDYTCPSSTAQMYLVARGGNPGLATGTSNPALVLVAALGDCGNLFSSTFIDIDEVTTVAAAWSLSRFTGSGALVGSSSTNATGLRNAFLTAANLADTSIGAAPGAVLPAGAVIESKKINTLANALAPCVNSSGGSACTSLFTAATVSGTAPDNVFDAALNIVRNPGSNVAAVFNVSSASAPFQPSLSKAPNDWTMSVTYHGGAIQQPTGIAIDGSGDVWSANYAGGVVTELLPTGVPAAPNGYADPALYESYSLAIDGSNNVWVTNEEGDPSNGYNGSISKFSSTGQVLSGSGITGGGVYYPYAIAPDTDGTMWVADYGSSAATILNNDGSAYNGKGVFQSTALPLPVGVALDGAHNAWFAATNSVVRVTQAGVISQFSCGRQPQSLEIDQNGNVWVADYTASSVFELNAAGTVLQQLTGVGGLTYPEGIAIDGAGTIWVTSYRGNVLAAFGTASGGAASAALSPTTGFGVDAKLSEPFSLAVDASGNIWVTSFGNDAVAEFVGAAVPVKTPVVGPPTTP